MKQQLLKKIITVLCFSILLLLVNSLTAQTRYWVGGTGSWTNIAMWSTTSGGAGGAAIPLSTDDVIFDAASGGGTVTITAGSTNVAKSVTFLATTNMTVVTGTGRMDLTDGLTLRAGMVLTNWTGQLYFYTPASVALTRTITTGNNTFKNSLIEFERPSSGAGGNVVVNGNFIHATGTETINLQNKTNFVTFNNGCTYNNLSVKVGTANMMAGFTKYGTASDMYVYFQQGALNSWGNGTADSFYTSGDTDLNAGNTLAGNSYTFGGVYDQSNLTTTTGTLSIVNCSIIITNIWRYGNGNGANISAYRLLNTTGSTVRFTAASTIFYPENYDFNSIICDDDPANSYLVWDIQQYYYYSAVSHTTLPSFNSVILDRNISFKASLSTSPAGAIWPTFNTLLKLTPGHRYENVFGSSNLTTRNFRLNIANGATLDMQGTCNKPIILDAMPFEFGSTANVISDYVRTVNVLARDNITPFSFCSPAKAMGANSYAISGTSTTYSGWDISAASPNHRNLVWVGNYNTTTPTISISPTLPVTTSNANLTGLIFTVNSPVILKSVDLYATNTGTTNQNITSSIQNSAGVVSSLVTVVLAGSSNTLYTLNFNATLAPGTYTLNRSTAAANSSYRLNSPQTFPINLSTQNTASVITITGGRPIASNYYNYYNWQIENSSFAGNNYWQDPNNWVDVTATPSWTSNSSIAPGNSGYSPACPPTHRDSVIFPNNSYVNCDGIYQYCEGMNWQGNGKLYGTADKEMEVWGSLYLSPLMRNDFLGTFWFKSERNYLCWITTNNKPFNQGVIFNSNNGNGSWLLKDSLLVPNKDLDASFNTYNTFSFALFSGTLNTGTAWCTPGNGQCIKAYGMRIVGGTFNLYDSDILVYGTGLLAGASANFAVSTRTNVTLNSGTSHFIFWDYYEQSGGGYVPYAVMGHGQRYHEITIKTPPIAANLYTGYSSYISFSLDTVAKLTVQPNCIPSISSIFSNVYSAPNNPSNGGLIRKLDLQTTFPSFISARGGGGPIYNSAYQLTFDTLLMAGPVNFGQKTNIRSFISFAQGQTYSLGTPTIPISIELMGLTTATAQAFEACPPITYGYSGAKLNLTGSCNNYININYGNFIVNSPSMATYTANFINITDNTVTGAYPTLNVANPNFGGVVTGWNGTTAPARKLRWKDVSAIPANIGDWDDANNWEEISGGTGTQTVISPAPQCPPTKVDTAWFDNTSFTATNQRVNVNPVLCDIGSMYWFNTLNSPELYSAGTNTLQIYANLIFNSNMQQNMAAPIVFRGAPSYGSSTFSISTITTGGRPFKNRIRFDADGPNKVWSLQDNLTVLFNTPNAFVGNSFPTFDLIEGEFISNSYTLNIASFHSNSTSNRKLDITNSTITTSGASFTGSTGGSFWYVNNAANFTIKANDSHIINSHNGFAIFQGGGKKYNNLTFNGTYGNTVARGGADGDEFHIITFNASTVTFGNFLGGSYGGTSQNLRIHQLVANYLLTINSPNCVIDSIALNQGAIINSNNKYNKYVKFTSGKTYTMGANTVQWFGNRCQVDMIGVSGSNIQMYSTATSQQAYFRKDSAYMCADYINMRDIWAVGNGNNVASCTSYSVTGINTICAPNATIASYVVSSCDTITDQSSACGPWDGANLARGRADFNAGANADLQGNNLGWAKRAYPPNPVVSLASGNYSVCPGKTGVLSLSGVAKPPFNLVYLENGVPVTRTISSPSDLTTYTASTGAFTYTLGVNPGVNTQYALGYIIIDRCFNPQSAAGTGTVNLTILPQPILTSITSTVINDGQTLNIPLTSNTASTYSWIAGDNVNTTGESLTTQTTGTINNTITNNTEPDQTIIYTVTPVSVANGCVGASKTISVTVKFSIVYLPVELIGFSSICKDGTILLKWETASEQQNGYYTIKKSLDGIHWYVLAKINGKGTINGKQTYLYIDNNSVTEEPTYYKIQQTDLDGETKNLSTITETCSDNTKEMEVLGNIVSERHSNINIITPYDGAHRVALYDMLGKQVFSEEVLLMNGRNLVVKDFSAISEGIYLFSVERSGDIKSVKLIVNKNAN